MISDIDFVLAELQAGPRCATEIQNKSFRERSCGLTVHSRVAELRDRGYEITCTVEGKTRKGFPRYVYRLASEPAVYHGGSGAAQTTGAPEHAGGAPAAPDSASVCPSRGDGAGVGAAHETTPPIPGQLALL